jgi:hypothetical protein
MTESTDLASGKGIERRRAERVAVEMFVRERDGDRLFVHPATNLSACGIFLESHSYSQRNAVERKFMELEFELPEGGDTIAVRGEVIGSRRVRGYSHGLAIAFVDQAPAIRTVLADFVRARLAEGDSVGPVSEAAPTDL